MNTKTQERLGLSSQTRARLIHRNGKRVRAHRWIMEQALGRSLRADEHVHHINGDPLDNRLDNLTVMDARSHMCLHKQIYPDEKACANCGQTFAVNPRKRKRSKCCSPACAQAMRAAGRRRQAASSPRSSVSSPNG